MADIDAMMYGDVEQDEDLLRELQELQEEEDGYSEPPRQKQPTKAAPAAPPARRAPVPPAKRANARDESEPSTSLHEIERLARCVSVESPVADDDNDPSVEMDDDLLSELNDIITSEGGTTLVSIPEAPKQGPAAPPVPSKPKVSAPPAAQSMAPGIADELQKRRAAFSQRLEHANRTGDDRKIRQLQRICGQYDSAMDRLRAGQPVSLADLPVPPDVDVQPPAREPPAMMPMVQPPRTLVPTPTPQKSPLGVAQQEKSPSVSSPAASEKAQLLRQALAAKKQGDLERAKQLLVKAKQLGSDAAVPDDPRHRRSVEAKQMSPQVQSAQTAASRPPQGQGLSLVDSLRERMTVYQETAKKAAENGDTRRARQSERIAKQFADALRSAQRGKPVNVEELPCPPGFEPLAPVAPTPTFTHDVDQLQPAKIPSTASAGASPGASKSPQNRPAAASTSPQAPAAASVPPPPSECRQTKQLDFLLRRQAQFKQAAIASKQRGDLDAAKRYLLQAKGLDEMIEASRSGLPVDVRALPVPPQVRTTAAQLQPQLSLEAGGSPLQSADTQQQIFATLEADLITQVQTCERNQEYFTRLGNVAEVTKFEELAKDAKRDLISLRQCAQRGRPPPEFHYERRGMPVLDCNPDVADDDLELGIVRCVAVRLPDGYKVRLWAPLICKKPLDANAEEHGDLYVRFDFPWPAEAHQTGRTQRVYASASPEFNERHRLRISRATRQFGTVVKRRAVKFEVWQRGGFLRSDKLCGVAELKLALLEGSSTVHQSLQLLEGRRAIPGSKIEVRLRIKQSFGGTGASAAGQSTMVKWLVIDHPTVVRQPAPPQQQRRSQQPVRLPRIPAP